MMHKITVRAVNVTESNRFGQAESYHGQDYRPRLRKRVHDQHVGLDSRVSSRKGGTSTPFEGS